MSDTYTTESGDVWDLIAYKVYGDEMRMDWLMKNNIAHLDTFVFGAGVKLNTPALPETTSTQTAAMPAWRSST